MRQKGIVWIGLWVILALIKGLVISSYFKDYGEGRIEVELTGIQINYEDLLLMEGYESLNPVIFNRQKHLLEGQRVLGIGTTSGFNELERMVLINGSFFEAESVSEGRKVVIISDELALQLYGTYLATQNECEIDGVYYEVGGVYKKNRNLEDLWQDDGQERVYYPITSQLGKGNPLQCLMIDKNKAGVQIEDLSQLGLYRFNCMMNNQLERSTQIKSQAVFPLGLLGVVFIYFSLKRIRQSLKAKTTKQTLVEVMILSSELIGGYFLVMKQVYIPIERLPSENIFDLSYYWQQFKALNQLRNYMLQLNSSHFARAYEHLKLLVGGINGLQVLSGYLTIHSFSRRLKL